MSKTLFADEVYKFMLGKTPAPITHVSRNLSEGKSKSRRVKAVRADPKRLMLRVTEPGTCPHEVHVCTNDANYIPALIGEIGTWLASREIEFTRVGC